MQIAIQYARSKQVVTFAAAGNAYQDGNQATYPAAYPEAVAVAAIDQTLDHASFSNTGSYVDIAAPGDLIWSTYGQGRAQYALMSGTSMATPYATATAALVLGENPTLSASELVNAIEANASDLGAPGRDNVFGYGLINPRGALLAASPEKVNRGTKGHGYWIVTADGQVRTYGTRAVVRRPARPCALGADRRRGAHERRQGLLARRRGRRGLRVRRRAVPRWSAGPAAQLADRRDGRVAERDGIHPARPRRRRVRLRRRALLRLDRWSPPERARARRHDDGRRQGLLVRRGGRRRLLVRQTRSSTARPAG